MSTSDTSQPAAAQSQHPDMKKCLEGKSQNQRLLPMKQDWSKETLPASGCCEPEKPPLAASHSGWSAQAGVCGAGRESRGRGVSGPRKPFWSCPHLRQQSLPRAEGEKVPTKKPKTIQKNFFLLKQKQKKHQKTLGSVRGVVCCNLV